MKNTILVLISIFSFLLLNSCGKAEIRGSYSDSDCEDTNCRDYSSQSEAQLDYEWNPECRGDLDADNDGIACEENHWTDYYNSISSSGGSSGGGTGCPTTSACGCSGHNMSECNSDPCCKWTVGEGCGCN